MKAISGLLLTASTLFIFSCDRSGLSNAKDKDLTLEPVPVAAKPSNDLLSNNQVSDSSPAITLQGSLPGQNPDWDKKIVKTAFLKLEVKDFKLCSDIVHQSAKRYGAYIAGEEQNQSHEKKESTISIKVPVEQFENLLNQLPSDSDKIIDKNYG
jgi:hypothetical protein